MRGRGAIACVIAVSALALPAAATAKPEPLVIPPYFALHAELPSSNGYKLALDSVGHRKVTLTANRNGARAVYSTPGRASKRGIGADFGAYGRIDLRFVHPSSGQRGLEGCKGKPADTTSGLLRGSVRFRGEDSYVNVLAHAVKGEAEQSHRLVCPPIPDRPDSAGVPRPTPGEGLATNVLEAWTSAEGREVEFEAVQLGLGSISTISAETVETVGRVQVLRSAVAKQEAGLSFSKPDADPRTATVQAQAAPPFLGSAAYEKQTGTAATWAGDLSVSLPGVSDPMPLAGPGFQAATCRRPLFDGFNGCRGSLRG